MLKLIAGDPMDPLLVDLTKIEINEMTSKQFVFQSKMVLKDGRSFKSRPRGLKPDFTFLLLLKG
jgi:hypothetical protein